MVGSNRANIVGSALQNELTSLLGDETAVNSMKGVCRTFYWASGITTIEGNGNRHSTNTAFSGTCPIGYAAYAILTIAEPHRGNFADDTDLNDVQLASCAL